MLSKAALSAKRRRQDFLAGAREQLLAASLTDISARELALRTGVTPSFVCRQIGDRNDIFRIVLTQWIDDVAARAPLLDTLHDRPSLAVAASAEALAKFFADPLYRGLMVMMVRHQGKPEWLLERHRKLVLAPLEMRIFGAIVEAGRHMGLALQVRDQGIGDFIDRLETAFALEPFKPRLSGLERDRSARIRKQCEADLLAAVYEEDRLLSAA